MTSKQTFKLYEPIILLKALNKEADVEHDTDSPEVLSAVDINNPDELFRAFVYKLAHICDSRKGDKGATITAFMVLQSQRRHQEDDMVHYLFASNGRNKEQLDGASAYIDALLRMVRLAPEDFDPTKGAILRLIIHFNSHKLRYYFSQATLYAQGCLEHVSEAFGPNENIVTDWLVAAFKALGIAMGGAGEGLPEAAFVYACERAIRRLAQLERLAAGKLITRHVQNRATLGQPSNDCWYHFRHAISRILAYPHSLNCIFRASHKWPVLFDRFHVFYLQSSKPHVGKNWRNKSLSAETIVGRLTRRIEDIQRLRDYAKDLQIFELDERITTEFQQRNFQPFVHCEILLLNYLEFTEGGINATRFFEGSKERMYIGTSKPLCKLCKYYFEEHGSGVGHRPSHENLYPSWRLPDVLASQGPEAIDRRDKMVDKLLKRIRAEAFDLLRRRARRSGKENDSNTFSANPPLRAGLSTITESMDDEDDMDDMATMFGGVSLKHGQDDDQQLQVNYLTTGRRYSGTQHNRSPPAINKPCLPLLESVLAGRAANAGDRSRLTM